MAPAVPLLASAIAESALSRPACPRPALHAFAGAPDDRAPVLVVAGTRPECIKLAPLLHALHDHPDFATTLINSGQHREAVRRCLAEFGLRADIELASLPASPHMAAAHASLRQALSGALRSVADAGTVVVQGDTLTAYSAAREAFAVGHRVAHVEAGLRTEHALEPFPEEWFRRRIARFAHLHFAPSRIAVDNLVGEGIDTGRIHNVGNTGIDSLRRVLAESGWGRRERRARTVLVTLHRRSNYDRNCAIVCAALLSLAAQRPELRFLFPVHPNPRVSGHVRRLLGADPRFDLVEPLAYRHFIECAARAALIVSDSGGIQEEAAHLGTPLLVPRSNTERPECLATGFVRLIDVDHDALLAAALDMLDAPRRAPLPIDERAPFGAGDAAARIVGVLEAVVARRAYA